ncbi:MAG: hypothetical protein ABIL25_07895 [candidate division WOR-3 bacterium]
MRILAVLIAATVLVAPVLADTTWVTVGSPYVKNSIPFWGSNYDAMRFQALYLQSEINQAGTIVAFCLSSTEAAPAWFYKVRVKLCHTSVSQLGSEFAANYSGNTPQTILDVDSLLVGTGSNGTWYYFPAGFNYNNTDNLLLEIAWRGDAGQTVTFWRNPNGTNRRLFAYNDDEAQYGTVDNVMAYHARIGFVPTAVTEPKLPVSQPPLFEVRPSVGRPPFRVLVNGVVSGELAVCDITGRTLERLPVVGNGWAGEAVWNPANIRAGVYLVRPVSGPARPGVRVVVTD